jgi:DNA polymerase-4
LSRTSEDSASATTASTSFSLSRMPVRGTRQTMPARVARTTRPQPCLFTQDRPERYDCPMSSPELGPSPSRWPRAILHLDMDAFFVNVHRLHHPEDEGIPVAVGGSPDGRGVVASASYEARQFGVRSAMPMRHALRLCPDLKIVGHDWPQIQASSRQVMEIMREFGPVEPMSVDEAYLDLTDAQGDDLGQLAQSIRLQVKNETGLPASVGLATSKLVAKVASDHDKPEGCTIVPPGTEAAFLAPLSVRAIWGIGPRTAERLALLNIHTCGDLAETDAELLVDALGPSAGGLAHRARGEDTRSVSADRGPARSVSAETTFRQDSADLREILPRLDHLCERVGASMRKRELVARTVFVKFRWADFTTFTRQTTVEVPVFEDVDLKRIAAAIWMQHWHDGQRVRLVGMGVSKLEEASVRQLGMGL